MHDVFNLRQLELAGQSADGRTAPSRVRAGSTVDVPAAACDVRALESNGAGPRGEAGRVAAAVVVGASGPRLMPVLVWRL